MPDSRPVIIAIDGRSGAGKTTLAVELATLLRRHRPVSLFHLEDIYPGWDGLAGGLERYLDSVLEPLSHGLSATWTAWDWQARNDGDSRTTAVTPVVLVEGVGAAHGRAADFLDAVIWVDAPGEARKQRALERDGQTYAPFWDQWAAQEERLVMETAMRSSADIVVDGTHGVAHAPIQVLDGLTQVPALEHVLAPELARRRGLEFSAVRIAELPQAAQLFQALYGESDHAVWLDSSMAESAGTHRSRFSIMADPSGCFGQIARHDQGMTTVTTGQVSTRIRGPFFTWLDTVWGRRAVRAPKDYPAEFTLGWLGYLGYELKAETGGAPWPATQGSGTQEPIDQESPGQEASPDPSAPVSPEAPPLADALLLFAGRAVVLDHREECLYVLTLTAAHYPAAADEAETFLGTVRQAVRHAKRQADRQADREAVAETIRHTTTPTTGPAPHFAVRDAAPQYKSMIAAAQAQIREGNSYEVCLTTQLASTTPQRLDPWGTYQALRRRNPAPFAAFLRLGGLSVCSTSPERFLSIAADGLMRAEPIKGTRRRDPDPTIDDALKTDLMTSVKDRAENVMIVDLLRNDLSRFALPQTLTVPRLCAIESYATVHQMVSTIEARLVPGSSRAQAVAAAFPAGSMTGAPKISTMAILDGLETGPRGIYSGAIGYFSLNAATDLSVVIRTLVLQDTFDGGTHLSLGVGGAITADSVDEAEWEEIQAKAYGVLSTLGSGFPT